MKYLAIIAALIAVVTGITFYLLKPLPPPPTDQIALAVNGRNISETSIERQQLSSGYHQNNRADLYETVITRELLIQEAQKQHIDKEESFRKALKEYYENSLIKILLERKNRELEITVDQKLVDRYLARVGATVSFTRLDGVPKSLSQASQMEGEQTTAKFDDLAEPLRLLLATLDPGEFGIRFDTGNERYAIRLDQITLAENPSGKQTNPTHVRQMYEDFLREQAMNKWIAELNENAEITIYQDSEKP